MTNTEISNDITTDLSIDLFQFVLHVLELLEVVEDLNI
jgi:hypothetical protein